VSHDLHVDEDITRAETLPAWTFTDRDFARRELQTVFARTWQLVPERTASGEDARPLRELLDVRGARTPVSVNDRPLFLQRGWDDDELRAFPNTCTHAWYPLVSGPSRGPTIVCGQHGRKFDCLGRFQSQTGFSSLPDFPRACDHLETYPVAAWRGLLFVCPGTPAVPLADLLAPVEASVAGLPQGGRLVPQGGRELDGNWKQHGWNYMDRFHIGFIHRAPRGLADAVDMGSYTTELHGGAALQWVYARDPSHGFAPERLPARFADPKGRRVFALWWFVFPNLTLNFYPWGLSVNVYEPLADRPERMRFHWFHLVTDEGLYERRDELWLIDQVDREDVDAMSHVRRGIRSGSAPRGRFAPGEEIGPHWFHRQVASLLSG
jgi:choline monooxygenase